MSTRIIKVCDRCYKEYSPYEIEQVPVSTELLPIQNVKFSISRSFNECDPTHTYTNEYDLCPQCAKQLLTWFYNEENNDVAGE